MRFKTLSILLLVVALHFDLVRNESLKYKNNDKVIKFVFFYG